MSYMSADKCVEVVKNLSLPIRATSALTRWAYQYDKEFNEALHRGNITEVSDLYRLRMEDLLRIRHFGHKSLKAWQSALNDAGIVEPRSRHMVVEG